MSGQRPYRRRNFSILFVSSAAIASMVVLAGFPAGAHGPYDNSSIKGKWGFFEEFRRGNLFGTAIGIAEFDGRGSCTVEGVRNGGETVGMIEFEGDCAYTLRRGGLGTIEGDDVGDMSFAMAEHGRSIVFIPTESGVVGRGEMRRLGGLPPNTATITGKWSFIHPAELAGVYDTSVGRFTFDGAGGCVLEYTENGGAYQTGARDLDFECAYEVTSSGWGTVAGDPIIVTGGGSHIYYMHGGTYLGPGNVGWAELTRM